MSQTQQINALVARGLRSGLSPEESFHLCELLENARASNAERVRTLRGALILVEEMKDCGGVTDEQILELHGLLVALKDP